MRLQLLRVVAAHRLRSLNSFQTNADTVFVSGGILEAREKEDIASIASWASLKISAIELQMVVCV